MSQDDVISGKQQPQSPFQRCGHHSSQSCCSEEYSLKWGSGLFSSNLQRKLRNTLSWADFCGLERERERDTPISHRFCFSAASVSRSSRGAKRREFKWAEASTLLRFTTDPCVRMNSNSKSPNSTAIKAEIKRHESLQSAINRLSKQFERVADQQLRSGLKVYLHSIQGKLSLSWSSLWWTFVRCIWRRTQNITCWLHYSTSAWQDIRIWCIVSLPGRFNALLDLINRKNRW